MGYLVAVSSGEDDFVSLTTMYRRDLLALSYRMLGSVHDAEDQVQETLLRARRSYDSFERQASTRTWLYRIAVNACLRALEQRSRRPLPSGIGPPAEEPCGPLTASTELPWLQPIPDALLAAPHEDPGMIVARRAGIRLALIAALQYLPPRQRAVLILSDALNFPATEVANLLGTTTAATNSLLQRARLRLNQAAPNEDDLPEPSEPDQRALLDRYAAAFAEADAAALLRILTEDATAEMPPNLAWFAGRAAIASFFETEVLGAPADIMMIPTAGNGQPAFASYRRDHNGTHRAHSIRILTLTTAGIAGIVAFRGAGCSRRSTSRSAVLPSLQDPNVDPRATLPPTAD